MVRDAGGHRGARFLIEIQRKKKRSEGRKQSASFDFPLEHRQPLRARYRFNWFSVRSPIVELIGPVREAELAQVNPRRITANEYR